MAMELREIDAKVKQGYLRVKIIIEIAGFPREHIEKTMGLLEETIKKERIEVIKSSIREPKQVSEKIWSSFIELEFLVENLSLLMGLIYDYMPSSVEIIEPEGEIKEDSQAIAELLNDLIAKLHGYSAAIKKMNAENVILQRELKKVKEGK